MLLDLERCLKSHFHILQGQENLTFVGENQLKASSYEKLWQLDEQNSQPRIQTQSC